MRQSWCVNLVQLFMWDSGDFICSLKFELGWKGPAMKPLSKRKVQTLRRLLSLTPIKRKVEQLLQPEWLGLIRTAQYLMPTMNW